MKRYLSNCFLLLIPIFLWNILLYDTLPEGYGADIFWQDIPSFVSYPENILRVVLFSLPFMMILSIKKRREKIGLLIYLIGVIIYFLSWVVVIVYPESTWSNSVLGFTAPAYTSLIWMIGIGLIGRSSFFKLPGLSYVYLILSIIFVAFHAGHAYIVFQRL
jgi:hypothetical protein